MYKHYVVVNANNSAQEIFNNLMSAKNDLPFEMLGFPWRLIGAFIESYNINQTSYPTNIVSTELVLNEPFNQLIDNLHLIQNEISCQLVLEIEIVEEELNPATIASSSRVQNLVKLPNDTKKPNTNALKPSWVGKPYETLEVGAADHLLLLDSPAVTAIGEGNSTAGDSGLQLSTIVDEELNPARVPNSARVLNPHAIPGPSLLSNPPAVFDMGVGNSEPYPTKIPRLEAATGPSLRNRFTLPMLASDLQNHSNTGRRLSTIVDEELNPARVPNFERVPSPRAVAGPSSLQNPIAVSLIGEGNSISGNKKRGVNTKSVNRKRRKTSQEDPAEQYLDSKPGDYYCKFPFCTETKGFGNRQNAIIHIMRLHLMYVYECSRCKQIFDQKIPCQVHASKTQSTNGHPIDFKCKLVPPA